MMIKLQDQEAFLYANIDNLYSPDPAVSYGCGTLDLDFETYIVLLFVELLE